MLAYEAKAFGKGGRGVLLAEEAVAVSIFMRDRRIRSTDGGRGSSGGQFFTLYEENNDTGTAFMIKTTAISVNNNSCERGKQSVSTIIDWRRKESEGTEEGRMPFLGLDNQLSDSYYDLYPVDPE
ncbi:hypothetical protein Cni_G15772 [Canna indica]|uniref:Uncharacterized protein n=1 Tax=Canna indica TaxID=4628 RepID=A0AAQ3KII0_9LILI|nr:hypothetical protein Cni_G15772 [Canna indica]